MDEVTCRHIIIDRLRDFSLVCCVPKNYLKPYAIILYYPIQNCEIGKDYLKKINKRINGFFVTGFVIE